MILLRIEEDLNLLPKGIFMLVQECLRLIAGN